MGLHAAAFGEGNEIHVLESGTGCDPLAQPTRLANASRVRPDQYLTDAGKTRYRMAEGSKCRTAQ